jgi:hypothetical protein
MRHSREHLIHLLTEAAEVEHNILCSYLYAAFSIKRGVEEGLTQLEAERVAQWRRTILEVAVEEMGHLAIVNNLLVAVGGSPHFDRPNLPLAPGYHPSCFVVRLTPFDRETLDHFIYLERPEQETLEEPEAFEPVAELPRDPPSDRLTPHAADYETIGQLYGAIRERFGFLVDQRGEGAFVGGIEDGQIGPEILRVPGVELISDLQSALEALDTIVEQGEGAPREREDSHFARYLRIQREWDELRDINPAFEPAFRAARDPVMRKPMDDGERIWITEADAVLRLDLGNALYGEVLTLLTQCYGPFTVERRRAFGEAAISLMEAVSTLGEALARLPANCDHPGTMAGLTFSVPRNLGFRAANTSAPALERLDELRAAYDELFGANSKSPLARAQQSLNSLRSD